MKKTTKTRLFLVIVAAILLSVVVLSESSNIFSDFSSYDKWGDNSGAANRRCPLIISDKGHVFEDIWNSGSQKAECVVYNEFDLSYIPENSVINSAVLKIKKADIDYVTNPASGIIGVYSASSSTSIGSLIETLNAGNNIEIDVKSAIQNFVNSGDDAGFLLSTYPYGKTIRQIGHGGGIANYYTSYSSFKPELIINYSEAPVCIPSTEICDGLDNDCDGLVDEGGVCGGECVIDSDCGNDYYSDNYCSNGDVVRDFHNFGCNNNECQELVSTSIVEECTNGCSAGECLPEPPECTNGETRSCNTGELGICSAGTQTCTINNIWGSCVRNNNPTTEICNDLDDDCDGSIDEGGVCNISCTQNSDCNDNLFCNGVESCISGICHSGNSIDCSGNDLSEIATCNNNPDNNAFTWDFRSAFSSSCIELTDSCSVSINLITHSLIKGSCGVECLNDDDCDSNEECDNHKCEKEDDGNHKDNKNKVIKLNYCGDGVCDEETGEDEFTCYEDCFVSKITKLNYRTTQLLKPETEDSKTSSKNNNNNWLLILLFVLVFLLILIIIIVSALRR